ncbi:MAG: hypothetical protein A2Y82_04200 [Candidatus Buchananbacteria bacterium RBG_13_36_9]|uniref:PKD domain-containing protein n=1 Tax=Candidatus Buchananbacteria bacterium RBG_13_36_9 TaxID=1797530 RepID=A0A1G1XR44_9BACT|nr:MAG: hypothetical protein A2Y82_04200 [Candidatus Buchananbacteria bacterium RBG_13_36_9]
MLVEENGSSYSIIDVYGTSYQFSHSPSADTTYTYYIVPHNYVNGQWYVSGSSNKVTVKVTALPVIISIYVQNDVVWTGEQLSIIVDINKPLGFEIGLGDGYGYSYAYMPSSPIIHSYQLPGIYNIVVTAFDGADVIVANAFVFVEEDWLEYFISDGYSSPAIDSLWLEMNSSIIEGVNSKLTGGQP